MMHGVNKLKIHFYVTESLLPCGTALSCVRNNAISNTKFCFYALFIEIMTGEIVTETMDMLWNPCPWIYLNLFHLTINYHCVPYFLPIWHTLSLVHVSKMTTHTCCMPYSCYFAISAKHSTKQISLCYVRCLVLQQCCLIFILLLSYKQVPSFNSLKHIGYLRV
jgi:hypothetical protein